MLTVCSKGIGTALAFKFSLLLSIVSSLARTMILNTMPVYVTSFRSSRSYAGVFDRITASFCSVYWMSFEMTRTWLGSES